MTSVSLSNLLANGRITKLVMRSVFRALDLPCEDSESRATLLSRFWEATREADKWIAFCDCEAISIMLGLEPGTRVSRDEREDLPRGDGVALRLDDEDLPPGSIVQFEPLHEPRTAPVTPGVAADELATRELDLAALVDEQLSVLMPAKGVQLEPSVRAFLIRAAAVRLDAGAREDLLSEPTAADFNSRVPIRGHVYRLDPAYAARDAGIEREQLAARSRIARFGWSGLLRREGRGPGCNAQTSTNTYTLKYTRSLSREENMECTHTHTHTHTHTRTRTRTHARTRTRTYNYGRTGAHACAHTCAPLHI